MRIVYLHPRETGAITPELVRAAITPRTKLLALASCHFLTGYRLDIAAGTAVRFEPGQTRTVQLVALTGDRKVYGFRGLVQGAL